MVASAHGWKLVGPWYRWQRAALPEDGRASAPALQKFDGDDFVERFLADPQHSLRFDPQVDVVSRLDSAGAATRWLARITAKFASSAKWSPPSKPAAPAAAAVTAGIAGARAAPSALRKLFLPEHNRHYLTVCELHCDMPGFPTVPRSAVCQAGFVLRRRRIDIPAELEAKVAQLQDDCTKAEIALSELEALAESAPAARSAKPQEVSRVATENSQRAIRRNTFAVSAGYPTFDALLNARRAEVAGKRAAIPQLLLDNGINGEVQGWMSPAGAAAQWAALGAKEFADTTHAFGEAFFPLTPLVPDPRVPQHDAQGRTIYFGVVPTVSADHDPDGNARFDSKSTYEIRCFVRRHDPARPRKGSGDPDCCGEVVWSAASEPFRLAPPFDLVGTAQRPITIQMPDLAELSAQVAARPRGKVSPVKFVQPQHMSPSIASGAATGGTVDGPAICFFSIPLITIIALFLLNLFLPIVVLLFNLWFLLALRFCIKPQIKLDAGIDAAIAAVPPGVDVAAGIAASVAPADPLAAIKAQIGSAIAADTHMTGLPAVSDDTAKTLAQAYADASLLPDDPADAPAGLGYTEKVEYEPHRSAEWKRVAGGRG